MTALREAGILGTGSYAPERILSNLDLEKLVETNDEWIVSRTGMRERRLVAPDQATSDIACEAASRAIADSGVKALEIDLIIVATVTPDHQVPSTACILQARLGLVNASAFDINVACTGFVAGLNIARSLIAAGAYNCILVIGAETMSSIVNYKDRGSCILFGDAAGAAIVVPFAGQGKILDIHTGADGTGGMSMVVPAGGSRKPCTLEAVANDEHKLIMKGNEVYKFAVAKFRDLVVEQLARTGYKASDIDLLIPHQVNLRIIESALSRIEIDPARIYINLDRFGNTSAGSVPLALDEARKAGRFQSGSLVSLVAFGAGLTWASTLIRW